MKNKMTTTITTHAMIANKTPTVAPTAAPVTLVGTASAQNNTTLTVIVYVYKYKNHFMK